MNVDTAKLRQFINEHFGPEDLRTFLFDYFRSVYDDLTDGLTKKRQIALLLEYCHSHKKFPDLLAAIQRERRFFQLDDYVQGEKAPTVAPQPPSPIIRNPRQIFISHAHQDAEVAQRLAHDLEAHGYDIWIAGLRRDQNAHRAGLATEAPGPHGTRRYHPMLEWDSRMIWRYREQHQLPEHPLEAQGYFSVGCEPCTQRFSLEAAAEAEKSGRSGRWAGLRKTECGLHTELGPAKAAAAAEADPASAPTPSPAAAGKNAPNRP